MPRLRHRDEKARERAGAEGGVGLDKTDADAGRCETDIRK